MTEPTLDNFVAFASADIRLELEHLRDIRAWAIASLALDYVGGDRVEIVSEEPERRACEMIDGFLQSGWYPYHEALAVGQVGTAGELRFDARRQRWYVWVSFDHTWTVSRAELDAPTIRTWRGPAAECPAGYEPSKYDSPEGKVKSFMFDVHWVGKAP